MADDPKPTLRLVSNRAKAWEFESLDRWARGQGIGSER
jgi:hypothetical protein